MVVLEIMQETPMGRSGCILLEMARYMHRGNTMKLTANLFKISLLLSLLPASAQAGSVSNLQLTTTSISLDFTGSLPVSATFPPQENS